VKESLLHGSSYIQCKMAAKRVEKQKTARRD
jgi:hypothetical protein